MPSVWVRPQQKADPEAIPFYLGARENSAQDESGRVLAGRYELVEVLASGGTAVVYTAVDQSTGGAVAVKVLYEAAREVVGAFFGQEGRLAARIQSPHLVHARHFAEEEGRLFIVFDLVPGVALPDLYFQELMPWRELCVVVLQVLAGLDALHEVGIVHRDVKPDNIIVKRTLGEEIHVTLLDLGFAWVPPERNLTGAPEPTRQVFGTDGFIAPELLGGGLPEPRNDLYSVGALMYMMLTAQRVPDLSPAPELMELPSPRAFVPGLPQSISDIVMRALSDVEARFQSAEEMAAVIRAALNDEAVPSGGALRVGSKMPASEQPAPRGWLDVSLSPESRPAATIANDAVATAMALVQPAQEPAPPAGPRPAPRLPSAPPAIASRGTSHRGWTFAAAMLVSAVIGGAVVQLSGDLTTQADPAAPRELVTDRRAEGEIGTKPSKEPDPMPQSQELPAALERVEPTRERVTDTPPAKTKAPPAVLAATGKSPASPATGSAGSPSTGRAQGFPKSMRRLEPGIRDCIVEKTAKEPEHEIEVRVRFDLSSGAIDQVRALNMGTTHPIARCIDDAVRGASPPSTGRPNETFTFFASKGPAPK